MKLSNLEKMQIAIKKFEKEVEKIGIDEKNPDIGYFMFFKCSEDNMGGMQSISKADLVEIMYNGYHSDRFIKSVIDALNMLLELKKMQYKKNNTSDN